MFIIAHFQYLYSTLRYGITLKMMRIDSIEMNWALRNQRGIKWKIRRLVPSYEIELVLVVVKTLAVLFVSDIGKSFEIFGGINTNTILFLNGENRQSKIWAFLSRYRSIATFCTILLIL